MEKRIQDIQKKYVKAKVVTTKLRQKAIKKNSVMLLNFIHQCLNPL